MLNSKYFTTGLIILVAFLGLAFIRVRQPIQDLNAEINHMNQKLAEAQRKNKDLTKEASNFQNEAYIERQLRLKLNYKKSDEEAVLIYKTEPIVQQPQNESFLATQYYKFSSWLKTTFDR